MCGPLCLLLTVIEAPYVERVELEYHFPAYTGLEPQTIEDGGDIAVLTGTEVRLRVFSTMATPGGHVALNEEDSAELTAQPDGSLTAGPSRPIAMASTVSNSMRRLASGPRRHLSTPSTC